MRGVSRTSRTTADAASAAGLEAARAAVEQPTPAKGAGSGDPLIGDLRRAGLLPLLVLHFAAREPEHDVPPVALPGGARPRGGRVGASRAALPPLLPRHGTGPGGAGAPGGRARTPPGPHRRVDRRHPRG